MMESNVIPRDLFFEEQAQDKLLTGVEEIAKAVKITLGPFGRTVLMESTKNLHGMDSTKDGVTVAKEVWSADPVKQLAISTVRKSAELSNRKAGDGTTTAVVLAEAIIQNGLKMLGEKKLNKTEVLRFLSEYTTVILDHLDKISIPAEDMLEDVATISANNDPEIGKIIADLYKKVGTDGIILVEDSQVTETSTDHISGMRLDRGYASPGFINNQENDECVFNNPHILVSNVAINNFVDLEKVLEPLHKANQSIVIIAPLAVPVINALVLNIRKQQLKVCVISPPDFGFRQNELMSDISHVVGGVYTSEQSGDNLNGITMEYLGRAKRVVARRDETIIIPEDDTLEIADIRIEELKVQLKHTKLDKDITFLRKRIATLKGSIGTVYVGGDSPLEQKELKDRVDDAVASVRAAIEEGVLPGGGIALSNAASQLVSHINGNPENDIAISILRTAICTPIAQILKNADLEYSDIYKTPYGIMLKKTDEALTGEREPVLTELGDPAGHGYDLKNKKYGNMIEMGVIDPTKVTKEALKNALTVATTILSTGATITMQRAI